MNILVISNGYGEDYLASNLIKTLKKIKPEVNFQIIPLVGQGLHYKKNNFSIIYQSEDLPSGGFIRDWSSLWQDLKAGLIKNIIKKLLFIRKTAKQIEATIAVGDFFCLACARFFNKSPLYFLPTAKSDYFMPHSFIELFFIKKWAKEVFPRDELTTTSFQKNGIKASYFGNLMLAGLEVKGLDFGFLTSQPILGLVPGSRDEAYQNMEYFLVIIEDLHLKMPDLGFIFSQALSFDLKKFIANLKDKRWQVVGNKLKLKKLDNRDLEIIISQDFPDVLLRSSVILGLAGTANEQAIYCGKKVVCFPGFGPQSSLKRFEEQQQLLGNNLILVKKREAAEIVKYIKDVLSCNKVNFENPSNPLPSSSFSVIASRILEKLV